MKVWKVRVYVKYVVDEFYVKFGSRVIHDLQLKYDKIVYV
nr:MAG: hypothetical protein [Helarchaeota virus Nidhogg Meg22_1012]